MKNKNEEEVLGKKFMYNINITIDRSDFDHSTTMVCPNFTRRRPEETHHVPSRDIDEQERVYLRSRVVGETSDRI